MLVTGAAKFAIRSCALGLVLFFAGLVCADERCEVAAVFANLEKYVGARATPESDFEDLGIKYRKLLHQHPVLESPQVDLKRLINAEDWEQSIIKTVPPTKTYGSKTAASWLRSMRYVNRNFADVPIDENLLKKIHGLAFDDIKFHGFEGRRILADYKAGKISHEEFKKRLDQAYKENIEVSGVDHRTLLGKYRSEAIDEIEHKGSSFNTDGSRYFTEKELQAIRSNPYMRLDEKSLKMVSPGKYQGSAFYATVDHIPERVSEVLRSTNAQLKGQTDPQEIIRVIIKMEHDLVSIHPFLDGNGRSIRLLGDLLRRRNGLPPALYPNESDLVMTESEALEFHRKAMIDYLNEWVTRIDKKAAQ